MGSMTKCIDTIEWRHQRAVVDEMIDSLAYDFDALFHLRSIGDGEAVHLEALKLCVVALAKNVSKLEEKCTALKDPPDEPAP